MPDTQTLAIETLRPEETQKVGLIIGEQAQPGDIYLLTGPLGAGKTCLTQGIAWGLGVTGHPRSPTFVLMTRYQGRLTMHHMDLYRISDPLEAWDLGLDEYLSGDGICVIEWADQAEEVFPEDALWINLDYPTLRPACPFDKLRTDSELAEAALDERYAAAGGSIDSPAEEENKRVITLGKHSSRYDSLVRKLAEAFPKIEASP